MVNMGDYETRRAELNAYIMRNCVYKWQVAAYMGCVPQTFSRKMQMPTKEFYENVINAVDKIVEERKR